ncbi:MAG: NUDIX domain-containing protein [Pseudomonadales bacterium]
MSEQPKAPVPAATVVILRERQHLETFMVVRHHQIDFASGALVFPGGKVDRGDFDPALESFLDRAHDESTMRAMQVAAIRESFEECGVLLARPLGSDNLVDAHRLNTLEPYRKQLNDGAITITEFLARERLRLACDQLHHFAHWITPPMVPKRFDTHFFLAAAPEDHLAVHDGHENVDSVWIRPEAAVQAAREGTRTVIFPTLRNLERLSRFDSIADAIAECGQQAVIPIEPWTEKRADGTWLCIPDNAGYDIREEKMPSR